MATRTARIAKEKLAAVLYRRPRLFRETRRIWLRAQDWRHRAGSHVFRLRGRPPEPLLSLDPRSVRLLASSASAQSPQWEHAWKGLADDLELHQLVSEALSEKPATGAAYRHIVARIEHGDQPYGFEARHELDEEIATLRTRRTPSESEIEVWIGESGKIGLRRGVLSLALARAREQHAIGARVGRRHAAWERLRCELAYEAKRAGRLYQKVLHPDFQNFRAVQACVDRMKIVESHLPTHLSTALDIGASYGQFSCFLEDHGFRVTAVEETPSTVRLLRSIRDTMGYSFEIFPHDVRTYEPSEPVDVVWAMSVFHFFTKNEADQRSLAALLGRLRPKVVFFQPPREDEYRNRGWYRIYPPDEFADLVRGWCGLTNVERLGVADIGRPVYKIS